MSVLSDVLQAVQLKPRYLFGLWLLGTLILFLPQGIAERLGITELRQDYQGIVGMGTLAALSFWCVQLVPMYLQWRRRQKYQVGVLRSLNSLSSAEWLLLAYCVDRNERTLTVEVINPPASALVAKGILEVGSGVGNRFAWPYTVRGFVWSHLQANPDVLFHGIDPNDPSLQKKFDDLARDMRRWDT